MATTSWLYAIPSTALRDFRITAQSMFDTRRIQTTVRAESEAAALRSVAGELHAASFYPVDIREAV